MADVTGTIGTDNVALKNAATEATLKLLLQATLAANKQTVESVSKIATKAGLDPDAVQSANENLDTMGKAGGGVSKIFYGLGFAVGAAEKGLGMMASVLNPMIDMIQGGSKNISDFGGALSQLPFGIGIVMGVLGKLAKIHEAEFDTYQKMTNSGATFGGSLTSLRFAAYNTRMTLDELGNVMAKNGEAFSRMGGSAEQGRKAFMNVAEQMMTSGVGDNLRALGYTSEQAVNGMASYIAQSGGRTKKEMQNTEAIIGGTKAYLENLDALAQITGKSREEQEKLLKEANANAAYEAYLSTLDEEGKKKAQLAMQNALATGGKAGADLLKSQLLGLPPMTDAARKLEALGPNVAKGIRQMGDAVQDTRQTTADVEKGRAAAQYGATQDMAKFGKGLTGALSFGTDGIADTVNALSRSATQNKQNDIKSAQDAEKQMKDVGEEQKKRTESQAATQVAQQNAMFEIQKALYSSLLPLIDAAGPLLIQIAGAFLWLIETVKKYSTEILILLGVTAAFVAIMKIRNAMEAVSGARAQGQGILGQIGAATGIGGGAGALGQSPGNAMWVRVVGGSSLPGGGGGGGAGGGGGPGIGSKLAEGLGGLGKGLQGLLSGLGKGAGDLIKSVLTGLANGMASLGRPQVMLGAVTLGLLAGSLWIASKALQNFATISWEDMAKGFVTLAGLGALAAVLGLATPFIIAGSAAIAAMSLALIPFAGAIGLIGLTLPVFTASLDKLSILNSDALGKVALSVAKLGASLITFGPFAVFGIPASFALNMMADSFVKLSNVDPIKLEKVAAAMQKVKDATPGVGAAIGAGAAALIGRVTGSTAESANSIKPAASGPSGTDLNTLVTEIRTLNKSTTEMVKQLKDIADHTQQSVKATKGLNGNLFKF